MALKAVSLSGQETNIKRFTSGQNSTILYLWNFFKFTHYVSVTYKDVVGFWWNNLWLHSPCFAVTHVRVFQDDSFQPKCRINQSSFYKTIKWNKGQIKHPWRYIHLTGVRVFSRTYMNFMVLSGLSWLPLSCNWQQIRLHLNRRVKGLHL